MKRRIFVMAALLVFTALTVYAQTAQECLDNGKRLFDQSNYDGAIQELTEAINIDPNMAEAYAYRSWAYGRKNNNNQALSDANKAIQLNPRLAMGYFVRGRLQSDNDRAIADYNQVIRIDPKYADAYTNRAFTYDKKGDYNRAIADYNEALRINPNHNIAKNNLADIRQRQAVAEKYQGVVLTSGSQSGGKAFFTLENTSSQTKRVILSYQVADNTINKNNPRGPLGSVGLQPQNSPEYTLAPKEKRQIVIPYVEISGAFIQGVNIIDMIVY